MQQVQRFQASGFNNPQPIWFYPAVLALLTLPWSPWLLRLPFERVRRARAVPASAPADTPFTGDVLMLMVVWLVVITAFFSTPDSKLIGYILPALAPLAVLVTACVPVGKGRWLIATSALASVVCIAAAVTAHFGQPKSRAALAERLREGLRPDEPVVFLANYYYDVAFYARLPAPALVVDDWTPADLAKDSWRRELADSEGFAAPGSARVRLHPQDLAPIACGATRAWVVGPLPASSAPAWLATATPVFRDDATLLWHLDPARPATRAALGCTAPAAGAEVVIARP